MGTFKLKDIENVYKGIQLQKKNSNISSYKIKFMFHFNECI